MFKTMWPFKFHYILKEDLLYYKKRHDELNYVLNDRNKELNKHKTEIQRLWKEKVEIADHVASLEGRIIMLVEEKNRLAETVSVINRIPEEPTSKDKGIILELNEEELNEL